jgi:hypothetical protein
MNNNNHAIQSSIELAALFHQTFLKEYRKLKSSIHQYVLERAQYVKTRHGKFHFHFSHADKYQFAEFFIDYELDEDNLRDLQTTIFRQLYDDIKQTMSDDVKKTARDIVAALGNLIFNKKVTSFEDLLYVDFNHLLKSPDAEIAHFNHMLEEFKEYEKSQHIKKDKSLLMNCGDDYDDYDERIRNEFNRSMIRLK